jgi:hypothetical protein
VSLDRIKTALLHPPITHVVAMLTALIITAHTPDGNARNTIGSRNVLDDIAHLPTEELQDLVPKVAASYGAENAMENLVWELTRRGSTSFLETMASRLHSPLFDDILDRVRAYQRAGLDQHGFDSAGLWQGWNALL